MDRELNYEELFHVYLAKWPILVISLVCAAVLALSYSVFLATPVYVSSGTLYITSENPINVAADRRETVNLSDLMLAQELAKSYQAILSSNTFLKAVADECDLGYDYKDLGRIISVSNITETEIMQVDVINTDPYEAQKIANTVLELAPQEIERIIYGGQAIVIDAAEYPEAPSSPNVMKNTVVGGFLGFILAAGVILLFYLFDNKVKSEEDLQKIVEVPILGVVPEIN